MQAPTDHPQLPATHRRYRASLWRQWALRVVLPLALAVLAAFGLLAWSVPWPQAGNGKEAAALWQGGLLMLAALSVVVAVGWGIAARLVRPISELTDAIERLGRGERVRLHVGGDRILGRLQRGVNEASQELERARNRMQSELGRTSIELADRNARLEAASTSRARFLAAASHDLRQPLYALTLFSSALRAGETNPDRLARVMRIEECVASLDRMFSELLDLSRLEAGAMQPMPTEIRLDELFDEVSRNFRLPAESRGLRLVVRKTDAWVRSDRIMLGRILNNLVSNALRYTDEGGVLVGVRRLGAGRIRIDVSDTGMGIAPEHQQSVFEEFYRVDRQRQDGERGRGLGLGLATVRKLAELLGCEVGLASRPGRGTRVSLALDACPRVRAGDPAIPDRPIDIDGLRVLVVDDDATILEGLETLLREWGCHVLAAEDEAGALARLAQWPRPPDLVISDLRLREGRNGIEVLQAVARHYRRDLRDPGFARLLVTGETRPDRIGEITASRVPVLFKPVSPEKLREAMLAAVLANRANHARHAAAET